MKKQPAKINYFFKGGYIELKETILDTFENLGDDIEDAWDYTKEGFEDFWDSIFDAIGSIFSWDFEWDEFGYSIKGLWQLAFGLGKLLCILVITTAISVVLSLLHVIILLTVMLGAYLFFGFLSLCDVIYRSIKKISSNCPNCQDHFSLPVYVCPGCKAEHTALIPSKYGIWKRKCQCGRKLPTTFFNGRDKIEAHCPTCGCNIKDGGKHVDLCIPVVGGTSSGKTCFINQSIAAIGKNAASYGLDYAYSPNADDDFSDNIASLEKGHLPQKTNEMRLKYYQFYLTPKKETLKNLISLCDVGGEVYADSTTLGEQIGYKYANAFLMIIDPLSISEYRREVSATIDTRKYGYSSDSVDEIVSMLISTLENMFCLSSKDMLKTDVAVVFTKGDIPGLSEKIGQSAIDAYLRSNSASRYEASNILCERFLIEYGEANFLNSLKSKFKSIQFFSASALGHTQDGSPFIPQGVEDPVLWLVDRASSSINLKDKWSK